MIPSTLFFQYMIATQTQIFIYIFYFPKSIQFYLFLRNFLFHHDRFLRKKNSSRWSSWPVDRLRVLSRGRRGRAACRRILCRLILIMAVVMLHRWGIRVLQHCNGDFGNSTRYTSWSEIGSLNALDRRLLIALHHWCCADGVLSGETEPRDYDLGRKWRGGGQKSYKKGNNELEKERVEMVYVKKRFSKNDLKLTI